MALKFKLRTADGVETSGKVGTLTLAEFVEDAAEAAVARALAESRAGPVAAKSDDSANLAATEGEGES
jgi:hypothetical protein